MPPSSRARFGAGSAATPLHRCAVAPKYLVCGPPSSRTRIRKDLLREGFEKAFERVVGTRRASVAHQQCDLALDARLRVDMIEALQRVDDATKFDAGLTADNSDRCRACDTARPIPSSTDAVSGGICRCGYFPPVSSAISRSTRGSGSSARSFSSAWSGVSRRKSSLSQPSGMPLSCSRSYS